MERKEFDRKVKENPGNDKVRTKKKVQEIIENTEKYSNEDGTQRTNYYVGQIVYLESDKKFKINKIDTENNTIELLDLQLASFMPIFREESIFDFERLYNENPLNNTQEDIDNEQTEIKSKEAKDENVATKTISDNEKENKLIPNIKKQRRNKIEYFDLHPEIPLKDRTNSVD